MVHHVFYYFWWSCRKEREQYFVFIWVNYSKQKFYCYTLKLCNFFILKNCPAWFPLQFLLRQCHYELLYSSACSWCAYRSLFLVRKATNAKIRWKKWGDCSLQCPIQFQYALGRGRACGVCSYRWWSYLCLKVILTKVRKFCHRRWKNDFHQSSDRRDTIYIPASLNYLATLVH